LKEEIGQCQNTIKANSGEEKRRIKWVKKEDGKAGRKDGIKQIKSLITL